MQRLGCRRWVMRLCCLRAIVTKATVLMRLREVDSLWAVGCSDGVGLLPVEVYGDWIPARIFGKCSVLCAIFRQLFLSLVLIFKMESYDAIVMDVLSFGLPLLRWKSRRILFYCHFPDKLLARRNGMLRRVYRLPFDVAENLSLLMSDRILVNSYFTASVVHKTFINIRDLTVLYPGIDTCDDGPENAPLVTQRYR